MSTPIETNTEELQEILQTVYNLPNLGGKDYDMVFELTDNRIVNGWLFNEDYTITCNCDYEAVKAKILNGEAVNVVLKHDYIYGPETSFIGTCTPVSVGYKTGDYNGVPYIYALFMLSAFPGESSYDRCIFGIKVRADGTLHYSITRLAEQTE